MRAADTEDGRERAGAGRGAVGVGAVLDGWARGAAAGRRGPVAAIPGTIEQAHVVAVGKTETLYFRRYANGVLHVVIVTDKGEVASHDLALITQYPVDRPRPFDGALVLQRRAPSHAPADGGAGDTATPGTSPDHRQGRIPPVREQQDGTANAGEVKPRTGTDGNGPEGTGGALLVLGWLAAAVVVAWWADRTGGC